jgi:hypothetical protein
MQEDTKPTKKRIMNPDDSNYDALLAASVFTILLLGTVWLMHFIDGWMRVPVTAAGSITSLVVAIIVWKAYRKQHVLNQEKCDEAESASNNTDNAAR